MLAVDSARCVVSPRSWTWACLEVTAIVYHAMVAEDTVEYVRCLEEAISDRPTIMLRPPSLPLPPLPIIMIQPN